MDYLSDPKFREELTEMINDSIDIPLIGEKAEGKIISVLVDIFAKCIQKYIDRMNKKYLGQ